MARRFNSSLALLALGLIACVDVTDYELDQVRMSPTLAIPLVHGSISLADLLNDADSSHIKVYPDGLIYLAYEEALRTQALRELFIVPEKSVNRSFIIPAAVLPPNNQDLRSDSIVQVVDLAMSPETVDEIALRSGRITFNTSIIPSSVSLNYEVIVSLPDFVSRVNNKPLNSVITGASTLTLDNYTMFLDDNKFDLKLVLVFKKHNGPIVVPPGTSVNVQLGFGAMEFTYIKGFLGQQSVSLPAESLDVGVFSEVFDKAEISLAQPKVSLSVTNENGVPCTVDFRQLEARKPGIAALPIVLSPPNPVAIAFPLLMGSTETTSVTVANMKDLLDFAPSEFYYQADARINDGLTSGNNFLLDTSKLIVNLGVEIPLYGSASQVELRDTLEIDLSGVELSQINTASLRLKLINELPLDGSVQLFLTDDQYEIIEALLPLSQTTIIKGSTVDASGELVSPGVYENVIDLDKARIDRIFGATYVIMTATLQTSRGPNGEAIDVKFKSAYRLSVEAGLLANLKLAVDL